MADSIHVIGLPEFQRELAKFTEAHMTRELEDARAEVADLVISRARVGAARPVQRKAAESLEVTTIGGRTELNYGGQGYPFAMGAEFGAIQYRQFPPFTGSTGYFLYPAVRETADEAQKIYLDAFDDMVKDAFPD